MRIATFNINNLFSRWVFRTDTAPVTAPDGTLVFPPPGTGVPVPAAVAAPATAADPLPRPEVVEVTAGNVSLTGVLRTYRGRLVRGKDPKARAWLARRIAALDADVLALQEVEDQEALDVFHRDDLAALGLHYPYRTVVEGNDDRRIDVAVLARVPVRRVSSWRFWPDPGEPGTRVFSRDLLQVEVRGPGRPVQLFINHLKSPFIPDEFKLSAAEREVERKEILDRRHRQAAAIIQVLRLVRVQSRVVVLGDMNDDPTSVALSPLADAGLVEHIGSAHTMPGPNRHGDLVADRFADLSPTPWTHRFKGREGTHFGLFDQIWTSPDLAGAVTDTRIMRRTQITGDGSDHDPSLIDLDL
jgi:endonuclease/exonuclease/phosphatase family metal-dependent hydrolase